MNCGMPFCATLILFQPEEHFPGPSFYGLMPHGKTAGITYFCVLFPDLLSQPKYHVPAYDIFLQCDIC